MADRSNPTIVVKTKLAPPRLAGTVQRRSDLVASLIDQCDKRLTVLVGPAGCGKTTLLALYRQALVTQGRATCWCNLGAEDVEPALFVTYLVAALQSHRPGLGETALALYLRGQARGAEDFVAALVNELLDIEEPIHLFVEDVHLLGDSSGTDILERLLAHAPLPLRLVVSSRVRPPFDYLRLRVADQLNELSFADLRFSLRESVEFLHGQGLSGLGPSRLHRLHNLADGWAAGLQILAYSSRRSRNPVQFLERFSGPLTPDKAASLTDYLTHFVGPLLTDRETEFLVKISACRRFDVELCEAITGEPQARAMLQRFVDDSLFVLPIDYDDDRQWFRLHTIFAKFLNDRLVRLPKAEIDRINRVASQWFGERGHAMEAVRHAFFAGDHPACIAQIERVGHAMVGSWQSFQLLRWLDQLQPEVVNERIELLMLSAWANASCGRLPEMERAMALLHASPAVREPRLAFEFTLLQANRLLVKDDAPGVLTVLGPYLQQPPKSTRFFRYLLHCQVAFALLQVRDFDRMRDHIRHCQALYHSGEVATPLLDALLGASHLRQGHPREAKRVLQRAIESAEMNVRLGRDGLAALAAYLAETCLWLGDSAGAAALLDQYSALIESISSPDPALAAMRAQIRWHQVEGDVDAALDVARALEERGLRSDVARMTCWGLSEQVRLQVLAGHLPAAQGTWRRLSRWVDELDPARRAAQVEIESARSQARLRLLIGDQQWAFAHEEAIALHAMFTASGDVTSACRIQFILADVLLHRGLTDDAREALTAAVNVLAQHGLNGLLSEELTPQVAQLTGTLAAVGTWKGASQALALSASGAGGGAASAGSESRARPVQGWSPPAHQAAVATGGRAGRVADSASRLSAKELEVVALLSKALSNKSIGKALNISAGTVKWHLKSIYSKLGAVSREDAGIKARSLHIVD